MEVSSLKFAPRVTKSDEYYNTKSHDISDEEIRSWGGIRITSRGNMEQNIIPNHHDLFKILGKYPTAESLEKWVKMSCDQHWLTNMTYTNIPSLIEEGFNVVMPSIRGKSRILGSDGSKKQKTKPDHVRILLAYPIGRAIAIYGMLEEVAQERSLGNTPYKYPNEIASSLGKQELKDYFIQICENGPKVRGDEIESVNMQKICLLNDIDNLKERPNRKFTIQLFDGKNESTNSSQSIESQSSSDGEMSTITEDVFFGIPASEIKIPDSIIQLMNTIIKNDNTRERKREIMRVLKKIQNMTTEDMKML